MKQAREFLLLLCLTALGSQAASATTEGVAGEIDLFGASRWEEEGAYSKALDGWQRAAAAYHQRGERAREVSARIQAARVQHLLGNHCEALEICRGVHDLAQELDQPGPLMDAKAAFGVAHTLMRNLGPARTLLGEALILAEQQDDADRSAMLLHNLGNLDLSEERYASAAEAYSSSRQQAGDELAVSASVHRALAALLDGQVARAADWNQQALRELENRPSSRRKAQLLILAGRTCAELARSEVPQREVLLQQAVTAFAEALEMAVELADLRVQSHAQGYQARLYQLEGHDEEALELCRRAVFAAQQTAAPDLLYQWERQRGICWRALGNEKAAVAAYQRALQSAQLVRNAMTLGYWNGLVPLPSERAAPALHSDLADLLLKRAGSTSNLEEKAADLHAARDTIEQFRVSELDDYFRDECASILRATARPLEAVGERTAVVYYIALKDRTEILVASSEQLEQFTAPVGAEQLEAVVTQFRELLEKRSTYEFLEPAARLHRLLISPLLPYLESHQVETLVFIPGAPLRGIPMAALHDGNSFLVERFSVALSPSLTLMDPTPIKREGLSLLASALSLPVQDLPALEYAALEVESIQANFPARVLLNEDFLKNRLFVEFTQGRYSILHVASHAHFDRDSRRSFLLTYDDRITLDDLERLVRPKQYRGQPLDLLMLSACETATGDDRAALGLAGVAMKSGARSAIASLWLVDDEAASILARSFYRQLRTDPDFTKAKALQSAQVTLLKDDRYRHPYYWSPYLLIGNWL